MASDYAGSGEVNLPGENQIVPAGSKHGPNVTSRSNKVQAGQLPKSSSAPVGSPTHSQPFGRQEAING